MLRPEQVSNAIKRGVNRKIADGHNLYLVVKNGKGFWVYQFRDGNVVRSKELGSASRVSLAQARRAHENFAVALRQGVDGPARARLSHGVISLRWPLRGVPCKPCR